jgi:hypothetical protein
LPTLQASSNKASRDPKITLQAVGVLVDEKSIKRYNYLMMIEKGSKMATKMKYSEVSDVVRKFSEVSRKKYDSYAHAAGYLESTVASLIADLPAHKQKEMIKIFETITKDME